MKLTIPAGKAPAAEANCLALRWLCRPCAGPRQRIVLITDNAHPCWECGTAITAPPVAAPEEVRAR